MDQRGETGEGRGESKRESESGGERERRRAREREREMEKENEIERREQICISSVHICTAAFPLRSQADLLFQSQIVFCFAMPGRFSVVMPAGFPLARSG